MEQYATEFNVEYDYDVVGGKPVYIIHLSGKDGLIAIGDNKKERCKIRKDTLEEVKARCLEIRTITQMSHGLAEKLREELGIVKVEQDMPKYKYRFGKKV